MESKFLYDRYFKSVLLFAFLVIICFLMYLPQEKPLGRKSGSYYSMAKVNTVVNASKATSLLSQLVIRNISQPETARTFQSTLNESNSDSKTRPAFLNVIVPRKQKSVEKPDTTKIQRMFLSRRPSTPSQVSTDTSVIYSEDGKTSVSLKVNASLLHLNEIKTSFVENSKVSSTHYFRCANPIGRLGNMMFQLASTIGLSHTLGYIPYIEPSHPLNRFFETNLSLNLNLTNVILLNEQQCKDRIW